MAFRIHDSVVRGEIDNRVKGVVRGRIWVEGRTEPVLLDLKGNAWPDLAGSLLTFKNPLRRVPHAHLDSLHALQRGSIGDLTEPEPEPDPRREGILRLMDQFPGRSRR